MIGQPLNAYMLHRVPVGKWLAGNVLGWGACILLAITATNFAALATSRFFLGLFEAVNNPAFVLITAQYYTRKEHWPTVALEVHVPGVWRRHGPMGGRAGRVHAGLAVEDEGAVGAREEDCRAARHVQPYGHQQLALEVGSGAVGVYGPAGVDLFCHCVCAVSSRRRPHGCEHHFAHPLLRWLLTIVSQFNKLILTGLGYTNLEATVYSMPEHAIHLVSIVSA